MLDQGKRFSEIEAKEETHEQLYRRAYRDGWIQAINAIGEMMFEQHMTRDKAHLACWDHWEGALLEWDQRADKPNARFEVPPQP